MDFLYSGHFTSSKFSELKHQQKVTFSIDEAPRKIMSFVQHARKDDSKYVSCAIQENSSPDKCFCRFELISRGEFKDMTNLSLELKKISGEKLNHHLIKFIEKYKQKCEDIPSLKKQMEGLSMDNKKLREEIKDLKCRNDDTLDGLNQRCDCLTEELRRRTEEAKFANEELETLEGNLKSVKYAYNQLLQEKETMLEDINRFLEELDNNESKIYTMQSELKDVSNKCKKFEDQLKECKSKFADFKKQHSDCEEELRQSTKIIRQCKKDLSEAKQQIEKYKSEKEQLSIEVEGLRVHIEVLNTQFKSSEEKKSKLTKPRLFKQS